MFQPQPDPNPHGPLSPTPGPGPAPYVAGQPAPDPILPVADHDQVVLIPFAQWQAMSAQAAENARQAQETEHARLVAQASAGEALEAVATKDRETQSLRRTLAETAKINQLAAVVAGTAFVSYEAYQDAMTLLGLEYQARHDPVTGTIQMVDRAGIPVTPEAIHRAVSGPRFARFRAPSTLGGAPPNRGNLPNPSPPQGQPRTETEQAMASWRAQQEAAYGSGQWTPPVQPPNYGPRTS